MDIETLDQIAQRHQTDKATIFTRTYAKAKGYAPHYDKLFSHLRDKPVKILEIGVGGGESIRMWMDYFYMGHTEVFGVDVAINTNIWNTEGDAIDRYTFVHGDQSSEEFWEKFLNACGTEWDIIIDDGSHVSKDIITTFRKLWPALKSGGLYAIEDLNTSYGGKGSHFTPDGCPTQMEWIKSHLDTMNQVETASIDWLHFSRELVVMCRK